VADQAARRKLFKKFLPLGINSLLGSKTPPARSVVFTVDCGSFLQEGGAEALVAKARQFHLVLAELSQEMGSGFPVYVLFTKADKIGYFRDFVENFTEQEAAEIFGVTVPMQTAQEIDQGPGGYAGQQTRRLTDCFQHLYYALAGKRTVCLAREYNAASLPNIYEFPREFAKLRPLLIQFLVDLCRPSRLGTSPFLRGFYFTGSRNIPQWVFLQNLFPDVILADRQATSTAQSNVKLNLARRLLFAATAGIALLMAIWWTISYRNNSVLVRDAVNAARAVPAASLSSQHASSDSLQVLNRMRDILATLNGYAKNGVPLSYGGLLYKGEAVREPLHTAYDALFRRILLAPGEDRAAPEGSQSRAASAQRGR
jgi:type VI secretion system protein ImpL